MILTIYTSTYYIACVRCSVRAIAFFFSNHNTQTHEVRRRKNEDTKTRRRKHEKKTRNTSGRQLSIFHLCVFASSSSYFRPRTFVFSSPYFRHRTFVFSRFPPRIFTFVLSCFRVLRLLIKTQWSCNGSKTVPVI